MGENQIPIDCDVIQADGGTRTASITGACVALVDAITAMREQGIITGNPLKHMIAAVSVGIYQGTAVLDLDYAEDSNAETDMNVIMTEQGGFIEVQGTAEGEPYSRTELDQLLGLADAGIQTLIEKQRVALAL